MSNIWSNFNKSAQILITILVVVLGVSLWHSCSSESAIDKWRTDFAEFRENAQTSAQVLTDSLGAITDSALVVAESARVEADSLTGVIAERDTTIAELSLVSDSSAAANDSTFSDLTGDESEGEIVAANVPSAEPWIRFTFRLREENNALDRQIKEFRSQVKDFKRKDLDRLSEISSWTLIARTQRFRADSLHTIVINIPEGPPKEKFLFFTLPSRKTSFIAGGIVGVVGFIIFDNYMQGAN